MAFRPAVLSYEAIRQRAEAFLAEFHEERSLPVPIEAIVEFDFELEIIPLEGILDQLEVDAFLTSDLRRIYVDQFVMEHRRRRYRFSLAHEIGHHVLHERLYLKSQIKSVKDWEALQASISADAYAWFEFQANAFAALILVPSAELKAKFAEAVAMAKNAGMSDETLESEAGKAFLADWLATAFDVSKEVVEKRLDKDALVRLPTPPTRVSR
jgi:Zn-dependent peptidase ImmA (M78 family)